MNTKAIVKRNLNWFQHSGVMRPGDGFWGVAERIAIIQDAQTLAKVKQSFPCQTELRPGVVSVEHRRADCNIEVAFLFDLAAEVLATNEYKSVAQNLIGYLLNRSGLRQSDPKNQRCGLWGWAAPIRMTGYWTDDNAWVATLFLMLARRGHTELRRLGLDAAQALYRNTYSYLDHFKQHGLSTPFDFNGGEYISGLQMNPHWLGLVTMALAHADANGGADGSNYRDLCEDYYRLVLDGPPAGSEQYAPPAGSDLAWTQSEYAYLALTASICAEYFESESMKAVAHHAAEVLVNRQFSDGHWAAEHRESPAAPHLADLIYTDNWAVLGLYHATLLFPEKPEFHEAYRKCLEFLAAIQDTSDDPLFNGCWRGMFDTRAKTWGGGDHYEGGAGSIYSGWTNAPIAWAFLFHECGITLFAK